MPPAVIKHPNAPRSPHPKKPRKKCNNIKSPLWTVYNSVIIQYMKITQNEIGKQFTDTLTGATVTVVAVEQWKGGLAVCVTDPTMPNPAGIPGIGNYWLDSGHLAPLTSTN